MPSAVAPLETCSPYVRATRAQMSGIFYFSLILNFWHHINNAYGGHNVFHSLHRFLIFFLSHSRTHSYTTNYKHVFTEI
jgi:hypothetical protein